jgi:hypothetical protein
MDSKEQDEADRRLGAALRRTLRETGQTVSIHRKVEPYYHVHAFYGRGLDGPHANAMESEPSLDAAMEGAAVIADEFFAANAPRILERKDIPTIREVQAAWAKAHDESFDPNSPDWRCRIHRQPQPGGGNVYTLDGRPWNTAGRCGFCHDFGRHEDTGYCPDCEAEAPKVGRKVEAAVAAISAPA